MFLSLIILAVALSLSVIAAYYSIAGLAAIFAAAVIPIMIMGSILELAKVVVTIWLHEYWTRARWLMKIYLVSAVIMLMLITSMGIFGFLSKAHSDQSLVSGDSQAKVSIFDEKIRTSKENIDANRRALKQMDEAVDQVMGRSADEKGAEKAVQIRRSQNKERARLISEIDTEQKTVAKLNEEAAPLRAEFRKIEAEVGPIKYIAALIYGDNPDANILERAVRWVIMLLVCVFDPLAIMMLLASTESLKWAREGRSSRVLEPERPAYEPDDGPVDTEVLDQLRAKAQQELPTGELVSRQELFPANPHSPGWMFEPDSPPVPQAAAVEVILLEPDDDDSDEESPELKAAMTHWKAENPTDTLKHQRKLFDSGQIDELPWMKFLPSHEPTSGFGTHLPDTAIKGDSYVLTTTIPNVLYKFNGAGWIKVDNSIKDQYTYDVAYIDHLIVQIGKGLYDPELLSDSESNQIHVRLSEQRMQQLPE
ncbi:hypothetical protein [Haliscomenobacter sp.]|uniref:hypothetical protein n=1 Tax=Haliscomenobacter sp. TaxID=2717303 RepID=UPI003364B4FE